MAEAVSKPTSFTLYFVLGSIFLDAMGHGLLAPIFPSLIQQLTGSDVSKAAIYGGAIVALFAVIQFFATPLLGSLSDTFGRRPVLLMSFTAFGLNYLLMALAPSLEWLFIAQALAGLFGATPAVAGAFMADISTPEERVKRFGSLGAAYGLGFMFGPMLSGILAEWGTRTPIFVAAILVLSNATLGYFVFKESLPLGSRRHFSIKGLSPWSVFRTVMRFPLITPILLVVLLFQIALNTVPVIWPYFTAFTLDWTAREIGLSMGLYGISSIIAQGFLVSRLSNRFGDKNASAIGLAALMISSIGFALISDPLLILLFIFPGAMGFMANASLVSYMSKIVDRDKQGALQGAFAATRSVGAIITPLSMPWLFRVFTDSENALPHFAGAQFIVAAVLSGLALLLLVRMTITKAGA